MVVVPLSPDANDCLTSIEESGRVRCIRDDKAHNDCPSRARGTTKRQRQSENDNPIPSRSRLDIPDDQEFVSPTSDPRGLEVANTISKQTTERDTDTIGAVPQTDDCRLLFTRKPHGGNRDKARVGYRFKHATDEAKSEEGAVGLSTSLSHEEDTPEEDLSWLVPERLFLFESQ